MDVNDFWSKRNGHSKNAERTGRNTNEKHTNFKQKDLISKPQN